MSVYHWIPSWNLLLKLPEPSICSIWLGRSRCPKHQKAILKNPIVFSIGISVSNDQYKEYFILLTLMSAFILPFQHTYPLIAFWLASAILLGWAALLLWSAFGSVFKHLFEKHDKAFRIVMCLLLIYSAVAFICNSKDKRLLVFIFFVSSIIPARLETAAETAERAVIMTAMPPQPNW